MIKFLPKSLKLNFMKFCKFDPFPRCYEEILKHKLEAVDRTMNFKFELTTQAFQGLLSLCHTVGSSDRQISLILDYAHAYVNDKTLKVRNDLLNKKTNLFKKCMGKLIKF